MYYSLNQTDKWIFNKITEKILEDGGLEQFISFDETPDGGCFQNELLTWIINESKSYQIFEKFNENEYKKLNDLLKKVKDFLASEKKIIDYCKKPGFKIEKLNSFFEEHEKKFEMH